MRNIISILGIILIVAGILGFSYRYFTYTTNENVLQLGDLKVTAERQKAVSISPTVSVFVLVTGIVLVVVGVARKR